ncbi:leucine-rich repeat serine/threonine-protein kinase 1-like isoform X1 [Amphibalanus amphitrite]|uniref:leucine-rich repeat serine/threonine-protein kinase 1-like isoform X1 n=1 Tax=Amphibalanus amphitrite TaxID=1232801 RepID=UPI001C907687|nr:leucine-rich repeat serine/threonine-protein kinase 1-like isoform X1 [Amphibalanus amphitrite]
MTPDGCSTLLYKASSEGLRPVVKLLVEHGAEGRIHPVTRYSPLYIAAYNGKKDVVELLLKTYPSLVQVLTVERWSPVHACCITGRVAVLELLFRYPYPPEVLQRYRDHTGQYEYYMPFDVNASDMEGQTALYQACCVGSVRLVEALIKFRVKAYKIKDGSPAGAAAEDAADQPASPAADSQVKRRISDGIQALMSRLNLGRDAPGAAKTDDTIAPLHLDMYCNNNAETALHVAVRSRQHTIVGLLLAAGANPNLNMYLSTELSGEQESMDQSMVFTGSTALVEACRNRDLQMIDLLLRHNARDDQCKALYVACRSGDEAVVSRLLALRAHADPDHKVHPRPGGAGPTCYVPVMVNWHGQRCLKNLRASWLTDAAQRVNPKLKLVRQPAVALSCITRLDVSNNALSELPEAVFKLWSLRTLSAAQNKIEHLRLPGEADPRQTLPVLEELYLQENRLEKVPEFLFRLPRLSHLDLSNNKLQSLPFAMWSAPGLKELNVSLNLLSDLPLSGGPEMAATGRASARLPGQGARNPQVVSLRSARKPRSASEDRTRLRHSVPVAGRGQRHRSQSRRRGDPVGLSVLSQGRAAAAPLVDPAAAAGALHRSQITLTATLKQRQVHHHTLWHGRLEITDTGPDDQLTAQDQVTSQLHSLILAHNRFSRLPTGLACLAVSLSRLNLAYNCLTDLGSVSDFPASLKQLDASHNQISQWPEPATYWLSDALVSDGLAEERRCYAAGDTNKYIVSIPGGDAASPAAHTCVHRRHRRFDALRTLVLTDNQLREVQLNEPLPTLDESPRTTPVRRPRERPRLMFPNLSMLDLSDNQLSGVPAAIHELSNLSVLNISGNPDICELPPQMGLLSRLWNLNTRGCSLQEPLKTMIDSNKYKTMDVIGYLKSVLEDAKPYARMKLMIVGVQGIGKTSLLEQLRAEGTGSYKKRPPEHWAKRMGNKNFNLKTDTGTTLSTVGVDIGDWVYEKRVRGHSSHGPVTFRTWDFGGQREYYATHQYFLSRRSLYLVVWRIPDGQKGVNNIQQWLVNIQARAPNSPVIIVGTHYDVIRDRYPANYCEDLQQLIRDRFINLVDADKCGLPRVLDTIEVSCKTRHNIRLLCNLIYDTVYSLKSPGSKERLLEQRIPATYLALEDVITYLATERHFQGRDPVLTGEQYRTLVSREMAARFDLRFRDAAELNQATAFLHENGVVLHYDDATLKDLYFLDPQWLCDMLAHVVTVREINPFARNGVMRLEDLSLVFKSSTCAPADAKSYIISLLDKFEVAVTWDSRTLLIPSLLPSEEMLRGGVPGMDVRIPVRSRGWALRKKSQSVTAFPADTGAGSAGSAAAASQDCAGAGPSDGHCSVTRRAVPLAAVRRLLLLTYFPSGFWSRLLTRLLADDVIVDVIRAYFLVPRQVQQDAVLSSVLSGPAEWRCWQTGIELKYADTTLIRIRELLGYLRYSPDYRKFRLLALQEEQWQDVLTSSAAILEVTLPNETIMIRRSLPDDADDPAAFGTGHGIQSAVLEPNPECASKLLAVAVDHIDTLLEDWYPTLGTRFVHTSEGRLLVTRLLPCPACLPAGGDQDDGLEPPPAPPSPPPPPLPADQDDWLPEVVRQRPAADPAEHSDGDSGVGPDSTPSSRNPSAQGCPEAGAPPPPPPPAEPPPPPPTVYAFLVEECILASYSSRHVECPCHGPLLLAQVAPDTVFLDVGERRLIRPESVQRGPMLGRGAFGFVFRASYRGRHDGRYMDVAMKMLQPSDPGEDARSSAVAAYKAAQSKWERDPLQYACKAYCTARQELNILVTLRHPYIVPLVGLCTSPLSLVLELAPMGALDTTLAHYRRSGARLPPSAIQGVLLQVAKALEYLHQQHIIYRDLKSENVLVWSLPSPFQRQHVPVEVKLADYGISRSTLPAGTKGFAGTEGFMAPEIMRYNGEEEYTEKVDCFSFGMFLYELISLHPPFEGYESVKEHILEGRRPPLTIKEASTATYLLDVMVLCWDQQPRSRPSASQLVSTAAAPELTQLRDVVPLEQPLAALTASALTVTGGAEHQVWVARSGCLLDVLSCRQQQAVDCHSLLLPQPATATAVVGESVWVGDSRGQIRGYCPTTFEEVFQYTLEPDSGEPAAVRDICPLTPIDRVAVSLANGRLFITRSDVLPNSPTRGEGSFVMTELGTLGGRLHCVRAVFSADNRRCEIWCGQSGGAVSVFTLEDQVVVSQEAINHYEPPIPNIDVLRLLSPAESQVSAGLEQSMWTYIHPGCVVYHWDVTTHTIANKLDCSKLVPVSESMRSISIDEHLSPAKCQVTALSVLGSELYLGTAWGCVVVAAAATMLPITVFRPHEEEVRAIVPLLPPAAVPTAASTPTAGADGDSAADSDCETAGRGLVTVGRGYRSLVSRFCPAAGAAPYELSARRSVYALLWQPHCWVVD